MSHRNRNRDGDPHWITARRPGVTGDGVPFAAGARILWYPRTRSAYIGERAESEYAAFRAAAWDEFNYSASFGA